LGALRDSANHPLGVGSNMKKHRSFRISQPSSRFRDRYRQALKEFRQLQGDPHYVAKGMGIGVFIAVTPTIPFHTVFAIALAFLIKGSKPAAAIGVWFSNPLTIPLLYWGSFEVGSLFFDQASMLQINEFTLESMLQQGAEFTAAMILGGIILGILPGFAAYLITYRTFVAIRSRQSADLTR